MKCMIMDLEVYMITLYSVDDYEFIVWICLWSGMLYAGIVDLYDCIEIVLLVELYSCFILGEHRSLFEIGFNGLVAHLLVFWDSLYLYLIWFFWFYLVLLGSVL